jgi:thiol-disulfide isomerase/thioredoxin
MTSAVGSLGNRFAAQVAAAMVAVAMVAVASSQFAAAQAPLKSFVMHDAPKPIAAIAFEDGQGRSRSLADFKGKVVLLNIWATWCVPCRKEMPALDRLQGVLGGSDFEVVPLSIDRGGRETVRTFFSEIGVRNLAMYIDVSGQALRSLGVIGLPTTLVVDRAGQEIGRIIGPAEWDSPEIADVLRPIISKQSDPNEGLVQTAAPPDHAPNSRWRAFQWLEELFIK